jgi:hypothetical protein
MKKTYGTVEATESGRVLQGAVVRVFNGAGVQQPTYIDTNGTPLPVGRVIETDTDGYYEFYVPNGTYTLEYWFGSQRLRQIADVEIYDFNGPDASASIGFSHTPPAVSGTIAEKLKRFIFITDAPFNGDPTGVTPCDAATTAALAVLAAAGGGTLFYPKGKYRHAATITIPIDGITLAGDGGYVSQFWVYHDVKAISFTGAVDNLPDAKFHTRGIGIVNKQGYPLTGGGFPQATHLGTGLYLKNCYGSTFSDLYIEGFDKSHDLEDCALISFHNFIDRNCWTGRYASGYTNTVNYYGGIINNSSLDLFRGEVKSFNFYGVDVEAASKTLQLGSANRFYSCRLERLHISRPWFKWFQVNGDDNLFDAGCKFFWDGSALPGAGVSDFFIEVAGSNNEFHFSKLFNHQNVIKFTSQSSNNRTFWDAPFADYANSGNNNNYRFSYRFYVDAGANNRMLHRTATGTYEFGGARSARADGALNTHLRYQAASNMTVAGGSLTFAASDIAGPLGVPATDANVRKVTLAAGAVKRATLDPGLTGNGSTVYTLAAYIYLPSGATQVTRVRLGIGDGNFVDIYPADGTDKWHRVMFMYQAQSGVDVDFMIDGEGDVGDVFYIAFPSLSTGTGTTFIDRKSTDTTNTQIAAATFDSNMLRYTAALA